ncbi:MAG: hypothetical protein IAG10_07535 [Planctomycetaceae bacterium]|nr:hypothetical protein [Planctomycetaceae bacterium]
MLAFNCIHSVIEGLGDLQDGLLCGSHWAKRVVLITEHVVQLPEREARIFHSAPVVQKVERRLGTGERIAEKPHNIGHLGHIDVQ